MKLSIIVPVLNEAARLGERLAALQPLRERGAEVLVVDGGSTDATREAALPWADRVLLAPRGRASQMNAGAWASRGDALLFLHADTALPEAADTLIARALDQRDWGRFDVRIEGRHPALRLIAAMMNLRSRLSGMATGDQAVFVRRRVFESLGGFAALPLMEDLDLCRRLKRQGPPVCLREQVVTSGRRWEQYGVWRIVWLMWRLRAAWFFGADAHALALRYGYRPRAPAAVAVMAKAPQPGLAKTRLIPLLGAPGAARAQRQFTLQTLRTVQAAQLGTITLWCAPDTAHRFFRALFQRWGVVCRAQPGGDLGARMAAAVQSHFASEPQCPLILVGTDCPALTAAHLQQVADALQSFDAALIPAEDGGYVLLGLRQPCPPVFADIPWSTPAVLELTRQRLRDAGATWRELPALWDVDEPADWDRLQHLPGTP